jgi:hypothetical protein
MSNKNKPESDQAESTAPADSTTGLDEETAVKFLQLMFLRYQREDREAEKLKQLQDAQNDR